MRDKKRPINEEIIAHQVLLIAEDGEVLGEMHLSTALAKAKEQELDLMQTGRKGDTVVVKMLDFGKHLYKQKKQIQKNKQHSKTPDLKTIKITFKIGDHDLQVKKNQAEKFAKDKHPLKVMLQLRGRENHYGELAAGKVEAFVAQLDEWYKIDKKLSRSGNSFSVMLLPK